MQVYEKEKVGTGIAASVPGRRHSSPIMLCTTQLEEGKNVMMSHRQWLLVDQHMRIST